MAAYVLPKIWFAFEGLKDAPETDSIQLARCKVLTFSIASAFGLNLNKAFDLTFPPGSGIQKITFDQLRKFITCHILSSLTDDVIFEGGLNWAKEWKGENTSSEENKPNQQSTSLPSNSAPSDEAKSDQPQEDVNKPQSQTSKQFETSPSSSNFFNPSDRISMSKVWNKFNEACWVIYHKSRLPTELVNRLTKELAKPFWNLFIASAYTEYQGRCEVKEREDQNHNDTARLEESENRPSVKENEPKEQSLDTATKSADEGKGTSENEKIKSKVSKTNSALNDKAVAPVMKENKSKATQGSTSSEKKPFYIRQTTFPPIRIPVLIEAEELTRIFLQIAERLGLLIGNYHSISTIVKKVIDNAKIQKRQSQSCHEDEIGLRYLEQKSKHADELGEPDLDQLLTFRGALEALDCFMQQFGIPIEAIVSEVSKLEHQMCQGVIKSNILYRVKDANSQFHGGSLKPYYCELTTRWVTLYVDDTKTNPKLTCPFTSDTKVELVSRNERGKVGTRFRLIENGITYLLLESHGTSSEFRWFEAFYQAISLHSKGIDFAQYQDFLGRQHQRQEVRRILKEEAIAREALDSERLRIIAKQEGTIVKLSEECDKMKKTNEDLSGRIVMLNNIKAEMERELGYVTERNNKLEKMRNSIECRWTKAESVTKQITQQLDELCNTRGRILQALTGEQRELRLSTMEKKELEARFDEELRQLGLLELEIEKHKNEAAAKLEELERLKQLQITTDKKLKEYEDRLKELNGVIYAAKTFQTTTENVNEEN